MPSSVREQVLDCLKTTLTGALSGVSVYRSREVSLTRALSPSVVIMPQDNALSRTATQVDKNQLEVAIEIFVRGDVWDSLADAVDVPSHTAIMTSPTLASLVSDVRRVSESFDGQEADRTAGLLTVRYRFTYQTSAQNIARAV